MLGPNEKKKLEQGLLDKDLTINKDEDEEEEERESISNLSRTSSSTDATTPPAQCIIYSNKTEEEKYPNNEICTSKYTFLTFIPKNIIEQFSKMANFYFLIIGVLQTFREISTTDGRPLIAFPLSVICLFSALKDLFEDLKRKESDNQENNKQVLLCTPDGWKITHWKSIQVGNIVKVTILCIPRCISSDASPLGFERRILPCRFTSAQKQ